MADFSIALELAVTVSCFTGGLPTGVRVGVGVDVGVDVEVATGSGPNTAAPRPWDFDGFGLALWEVEATTGYHWLPLVWGCCWPYWEGAFVAHINCACLCH